MSGFELQAAEEFQFEKAIKKFQSDDYLHRIAMELKTRKDPTTMMHLWDLFNAIKAISRLQSS